MEAKASKGYILSRGAILESKGILSNLKDPEGVHLEASDHWWSENTGEPGGSYTELSSQQDPSDLSDSVSRSLGLVLKVLPRRPCYHLVVLGPLYPMTGREGASPQDPHTSVTSPLKGEMPYVVSKVLSFALSSPCPTFHKATRQSWQGQLCLFLCSFLSPKWNMLGVPCRMFRV